MRPRQPQSLAADPPPSPGHAGGHCLPVPTCPCCPSPASPVPVRGAVPFRAAELAHQDQAAARWALARLAQNPLR